jgi:hypothetical protein
VQELQDGAHRRGHSAGAVQGRGEADKGVIVKPHLVGERLDIGQHDN